MNWPLGAPGHMHTRHYERKWSVDPLDWELDATDDAADLVTFTPSHRQGSLQFSAYTKADVVTRDDLVEFSRDTVETHDLEACRCGDFVGFKARRLKPMPQFFWWLASGYLMLFATYTAEKLPFENECAKLASILASLAIEPTGLV